MNRARVSGGGSRVFQPVRGSNKKAKKACPRGLYCRYQHEHQHIWEYTHEEEPHVAEARRRGEVFSGAGPGVRLGGSGLLPIVPTLPDPEPARPTKKRKATQDTAGAASGSSGGATSGSSQSSLPWQRRRTTSSAQTVTGTGIRLGGSDIFADVQAGIAAGPPKVPRLKKGEWRCRRCKKVNPDIVACAGCKKLRPMKSR